MGKVFKFLKSVFKATWKIQQRIVSYAAKRNTSTKLQKIIKKIELFSTILFIVFFVLAVLTKLNIISSILPIVALIYLISPFLKSLEAPFISIRGFIRNGILMIIIMEFVILIIVFKFWRSLEFSTIKCLITISIVYFILWCFYSLLANNKMSKLINTCNAALFSIFTLIFNLILNYLPSNLSNYETFKEIKLPEGFTHKQILSLCVSLLLFFPLITNILAATLCAIKGYWIDKYNNGNDISEEMINQEIAKIKNETDIQESLSKI